MKSSSIIIIVEYGADVDGKAHGTLAEGPETETAGCMSSGFLLGIVQKHKLGEEIVDEAIIMRLRGKKQQQQTSKRCNITRVKIAGEVIY